MSALSYKFLGIVIIALMIGIFLSQLMAKNTYNKIIAEADRSTRNFEEVYSLQINQENDAYELTRLGSKQIKSGQFKIATITLEKAAQLEPKYRDAWLFLGMANLKNNEAQKAIESLLKAEIIDPINPETYKLLSLAYKQSNQNELAQKAEEKQNYLEKNK